MPLSNDKGGNFERLTCRNLSLWVSDGKHADLYWRSAMSGGRATIHRGKVDQGGDIVSVRPEGHVLTDLFLVECKHNADLELEAVFRGKGKLLKYWDTARDQAEALGRRPILIAKQNFRPALFISDYLDKEGWYVTFNTGVIHMLDDVLSKPFTNFMPDSNPRYSNLISPTPRWRPE